MTPFFQVLAGLLLILFATALAWRWASRHRRLPCPARVSWFLENPVVESIAGAETTLDRIGLQAAEHGLDVGCGPGRLTVPAARRVGPDGKITALDLQPAMLERLRKAVDRAGVTNVAAVLCDISRECPLPPGSVDRAWLVTVLGEIPDRAAALANLHRLLKPGGTLSVTEILGDPHYQRHKTVLRLAEEAGFEPGRCWPSLLAFTQNFTKPA